MFESRLLRTLLRIPRLLRIRARNINDTSILKKYDNYITFGLNGFQEIDTFSGNSGFGKLKKFYDFFFFS